MPTEWERTSPDLDIASESYAVSPLLKSKDSTSMDKDMNGDMSTSMGPNSSATATTNGHNGSSCSSGRKTSLTSPDPTAYVAKARVTRPTPPPPSYNPMQFVQIKPCNLYQTAQQQLKKAEEVKKIKEIQKEEPEEWQNNLDNWKSSRRKRVEHIIDRVVEVKKLELEEHDRARRKSKTFSEMIEERGDRGVRVGRAKLVSLAVYNEDESNDLSDLGIGTSSASGKSSVSEDYENNSVASENTDLEKAIIQSHQAQNSTTREYISSPGYDTSTSTAPASSPDPCEYTYEGAIQDYKQRVSKATSGGSSGFKFQCNNRNQIKSVSPTPKESITEHHNIDSTPMEAYAARRGCKIEERLIGFEVNSPNDSQDLVEKNKIDLPKIDISKRKEIFECASNKNTNFNSQEVSDNNETKTHGSSVVPRVTLRDHFKLEDEPPATVKKEIKRLSGDITSIKDRLQSLEQQNKSVNSVSGIPKTVDSKISETPLPPLKDRVSSLKNAATKEDIKKPPVVLVDARQLEIMKDEEENAKRRLLDKKKEVPTGMTATILEPPAVESKEDEPDRDDSGIHTSVEIEEHYVSEQKLREQAHEQQLNEAIAALAIEEQNLEQAANAVNMIETEFAKLPIGSNQTDMVLTTTLPAATNEQPCEMEFSINEALEIALEAIDKETKTTILTNTTTISTKTTTTIMNGDINCNENIANAIIDFKDQNYPQFYANKNLEEQKENEEDEEEQNEKQELKIRNEPIYENISTTSTAVDAEKKTIPNYKKTTNQSETENNQNNYNIESHNSKYVKPVAYSLELSTPAYYVEQNQINKSRTPPPPPPPALPIEEEEPYYQVPKCGEPYYDAPKHLRPIPVYENIEVFYNGSENGTLTSSLSSATQKMEPPKEKPPPPPTDSPPALDDIDCLNNGDKWSSENTYEIISNGLSNDLAAVTSDGLHPSPPIKRMNSTKRIKKELRHKRSSFLGIDGALDDDLENYFELTVAPPPDMAQLLQEERRLEKQLFIKAGLCDSSDTGDSRDSGVSENHSRQSSEPYTNSSEELGRSQEPTPCFNSNSSINTNELIYQNNARLIAAQTPLLQTVKGNSAESWTESATAAAAASKSLTEATATANAKMLSIEEKIREQEEVLRVERELLHLEQEELKRQRENLMLRENLARRELQHGAKMLMSANRHSLQDLNGGSCSDISGFQKASSSKVPLTQANPQHLHSQDNQTQQIYANIPNSQQNYYQVDTDYRKSMSDLNEFSKRLMQSAPQDVPIPPSKPMRAMHVSTTNSYDDFARQRYSLNTQHYGGSLVKIANSTVTTNAAISQSAGALYSNSHLHPSPLHVPGSGAATSQTHLNVPNGHIHSNMTRNTLHALSATPKPKYTDGWVQVQNRKSFDSNLSNDPAWLSAFQQKRKSVPDAYSYNNGKNNQWLMQEPDQVRQKSVSITNSSSPMHQQNGNLSNPKPSTLGSSSNGKPLPDSVIQTLTERLQSKGIGERKRFDTFNNSNIEMPHLHTNSYQQHGHAPQQHQMIFPSLPYGSTQCSTTHDLSVHNPIAAQTSTMGQDKILSVSGRKKCSHCGDELGRGAAMIIESLLLFYHINCFKCCVCHVQLGDGLNGTDVRVRNHKLHCQNCYSSDDGIKFSCV